MDQTNKKPAEKTTNACDLGGEAATLIQNKNIHSFTWCICSLHSQKNKNENIQQPGFAGGHPPNY